MSGIMSMVLGARTAIAAAVDEFFNRVTLLLPGDGTNGAQNNTFLDSSSNGFTITRNPTSGPNAPTQGTFSPFSQTGWSGYFDGNGDYLTLANSSNFSCSGNFTIEIFAYPTAISNTPVIFDTRTAAGNTAAIYLYINTSGNIVAVVGGTSITSSSTYTVNSWYYIAIVRSSNSVTLYVNGASAGTATISTNLSDTGMTIGAPIDQRGATTTNKFTGYLSNFRFNNTTARTISSTPTSALSSDSGTTLLTLQSNRFVDNASSATITIAGETSIQAFSPFAPTAAYSAATNGGSGYFDGTGDYLSAAPGAIGTNDFTLECWVYLSSTTQKAILDTRSGTNTNGTAIHVNGSSQFQMADGTSYIGTASSTVVVNQWYYIVMSRTGGNQRLFVNGVSTGTTANSTNYSNNSLKIGAAGDNTINYAGYISGVKLVVGTGVTSVTVPTAPPSATSSNFCANFTNAGITDATAKNVLETVGNAQISTTQSKWGGSSIACTTGTSYLLVRPTQNLEFGSGDFTIEFWWYPVSTTRQALYHGSFGTDWSIGIDFSSTGTQKIGLWASTTGSTWNLINSDSGGNGIGTTTITQNAWNHIAFVRSGTTWSLYVNGNRDLNLTSISGSIVNRSTASKGIGVWYQSTGAPAPQTGYIDDFRVSKFARYSGATITTPADAFPLS